MFVHNICLPEIYLLIYIYKNIDTTYKPQKKLAVGLLRKKNFFEARKKIPTTKLEGGGP